MDNNLRLAREHCRELLGENLVLSTNNDFLFRLCELQRELAVFEGNDYGIIPFSQGLPAEIMEDALAKLKQRYLELAPPPVLKTQSRAARRREKKESSKHGS